MGPVGVRVNWRDTFAALATHSDSGRVTRASNTRTPIAARDIAFRSLVLGVIGMAIAYASAFLPPAIAQVGPWLMAIMVPVTLFAIMILGAVRATRPLGRLVWPFLLVFLLVAGGFVLALLLPTETRDSGLVFGLPARAAVILLGVGVVPLFMLPVAYALTFDTHTLSEDDIARVRAARLTDVAPVTTPE